MSLLDDVSIVVTPNGYKAGRLYGVLPTATEGADLIFNGDFATNVNGWTDDSGATLTWQSDSTCLVTTTGDNTFAIKPTPNVIESNKQYKISFRYKPNATGTFRVRGGSTVMFSSTTFTVGDWNYVEFIGTSSGANLEFGAAGGSITNFYIDDIVAKEFTASDMDVTRATAATRVDENGLVNYAEVVSDTDLVTDGDFPTGTSNWAHFAQWNITNNKANFLDSSNGVIYQSISLGNNKTYKLDFTISNSSNNAQLLFANSNGSVVYFGSGYQSYIDGNHTLYFTMSSDQTTFGVYGSTSGNSFSIDNIILKEVDRNNVPRIDYTGGGCPHILAEPQRTNSVTYSEDFSNSFWTKTDSTVSSGFVSPSGDTTAYKMTATAANGQVRFGVTSSTVGNKAVSVFAKANTSTSKLRIIEENYFGTQALFDLNLGVIEFSNVSSSKMENYGNGWYRCTVIQAYSSGQTGLVWAFRSPTIDSLFLWGAQLEEGSFATSYIPTSGSAVTRNTDQFSRDGIASLINSTEGVLFGEIAALSNTSTDRVMLSLSDGTTSNRVYIRYGNASNQIEARSTVGGANSGLTSYVVTDETDFIKVAYKWKLNDYALWINGVEVATVTSGAVNSANTLNKLSFDSGAGTRIAEGKLKQLQVYKTALTDLQIESITSWTSFTEMANALNYTIY